MSIVLPTAKVPAETQDPKNLILFGLPKVGKTTILSTLENNLILDFENGSTYVDALKVKVSSLKELKEVIKAIKDAGKPYTYITIDTITALEEMTSLLQSMKLRTLHKFPMELDIVFGDRHWKQLLT